MKRTMLTIHRYLSLALAIFWIVQILTGISLIYARTLDDISLGATGRPTSPQAVDRALRTISDAGGTAREYFISGGVTGQIDILADHPGGDLKVWRVDGADGAVERVSAWNAPSSELAIARAALLIHKSLLAGQAGRIIVIVSALVLLANILIGLKLAWPMKRRWRAAFLPPRLGNPVAKWFAWHRALGLWILPFALTITITGLGLLFLPTLETLTGSRAAPPPRCRTEGAAPPIETARAIESARRVFPGASPVVVSLPGKGQGCYALQLRQPGEWRRAFGTTRAYVDARTFEIVGRWDATLARIPAKAIVSLYTIHTGEWAGEIGRLATLVMGIGLLATALFGLWLWFSRKRARPRGAAAARRA